MSPFQGLSAVIGGRNRIVETNVRVLQSPPPAPPGGKGVLLHFGGGWVGASPQAGSTPGGARARREMKSANGEDERLLSHRKTSDGFSQRQKSGAAKRMKIGRGARGAFQAKTQTRASSQTRNGIKREIMGQFSNSFQTSIHLQDYVVFKETAPLQTKRIAGFAKKSFTTASQKHIVSAARHVTTARKL